jgi:hypothetical protein
VANFEVKCGRNVSKNEKMYLRIKLNNHQRPGRTMLLNRWTLVYIYIQYYTDYFFPVPVGLLHGDQRWFLGQVDEGTVALGVCFMLLPGIKVMLKIMLKKYSPDHQNASKNTHLKRFGRFSSTFSLFTD